ncbi:MAG: nitroreductase family protein [Candidatus Dadabacteria bacterium]|nr:nitroreductase family protein [Candidatus Dadabacteria bacterium]
MELLEAMGSRRSVRFFKPWKPVEDWKIQVILQAARMASCQGNCNSTEAIVIDKRTYPEDKFEQLIECASAFNEIQLRTAPIIVAWLVNMDAWFKDLVKSFAVLFPAMAVTAAHGWTYKLLTEVTYPRLMSIPRDKVEDLLRVEAGQGIAHALLAATDVGLGCCLLATGRKPQELPKVLGVPENIVPVWLMALGYPAESPGQRPRKRFDRLFHLNEYGTPLPEDPKVREELKNEGLFQPMDPQPGRDEEIKHICRMFGYDEGLADMPKDQIKALYEEDSPYYGELPDGLEKHGV